MKAMVAEVGREWVAETAQVSARVEAITRAAEILILEGEAPEAEAEEARIITGPLARRM